MLGFLKTATGKLLLGVAVATGGYELWKRHKAQTSSYVLQPGHSYAVVLKYTGKGAGGPLSTSQIQSYLASADAAGGAVGAVMSASTDATSKTIAYTLSTASALQPLTVPAMGLIGPTFPAAYGTVTVQSVTDTGSSAGA